MEQRLLLKNPIFILRFFGIFALLIWGCATTYSGCKENSDSFKIREEGEKAIAVVLKRDERKRYYKDSQQYEYIVQFESESEDNIFLGKVVSTALFTKGTQVNICYLKGSKQDMIDVVFVDKYDTPGENKIFHGISRILCAIIFYLITQYKK